VRGPKALAITLALAAFAVPSAATAASTGGVAPGPAVGAGAGGSTASTPLAPGETGGSSLTPPGSTGGAGAFTPVGGVATLVGSVAHAPAGAPASVVRAIRAGNKLQSKPYIYGGGHKSFRAAAYDCSGAVSYALHGGRLLAAPLDSTSFMSWGAAGAGTWITVYANPGHAYAVIAGLRLDTSGTGGRGPRWLTVQRSPEGFTARHPSGL
jgi:hypothetical protein